MKTPRLLSLLPCAASLFCLGQPAHAGHWDTVIGSQQGSNSWLNPTVAQIISAKNVVCPNTGDVSNDAHETATADFYWIPDNSNDAPPSTLRVKETPYAEYIGFSVNQVDDIDVTGEVDDGLGDPTQVDLDTHYGQDDDNWEVYKDFFASSSHLKSLSVDQTTGTVPLCSDRYWGHATVSCSMTATSEIGDVTPYGSGSLLCTFLSYLAVPDDHKRAVTISCSTIEDSYYKGTYESEHGTDKYDHLRDPVTGAIVTDSVVTYQNASSGGLGGAGSAQGWQVNNIAFATNTPGFNSPTYQWSLSGPPEAFLTVPTANPVNYSLLEPDSNKFPLQGSVKVTVTDDDGTSATNSFGITWHLPYEENEFIGTVYTKHKRGAARVGPVDYGSTLTVKAEGSEDIDVSAVFDAGEAITAAAGQEEYAGLFKIAASLAKITDTKYTYGPENQDFGVSNQPDSGNWVNAGNEMKEKYTGDPNILPASLASDPDGQSLCHLYWYDVEKDKDSSWYADGYNIHGYDGNSSHIIFVRQCDLIEGQPFFVQYKNHDGSSYPGT